MKIFITTAAIVLIAIIVYLFFIVWALNNKVKRLFNMIDIINDSLKAQNNFDETMSKTIKENAKIQNIFDSQLVELVNKNYKELNERIDDVIKHTQTKPV